MAVEAVLSLDGGHFRLDLYPCETRERIADTPPELPSFDPGSTTWVYYDGVALERGRHEPVGIEVVDVADLTDDDLAMLGRLPFPSMAIRARDESDVRLVTLLGGARDAWRASRRDAGAGQPWPEGRPAGAAAPLP